MRSGVCLLAAIVCLCLSPFVPAGDGPGLAADRSAIETGNPLVDPALFPIAVWLQDPNQAGKYKEAGFNLYVALWKGPTEGQLKELTAAGMPVICEQNRVALAHKNDPIIIGWMHGDEPDNAQESWIAPPGSGAMVLPSPPPESWPSTRPSVPRTRPGRSC